MKWFGIVFIMALIAFGIVIMRTEIDRSGRAIGKLKNEVEIKEARNQYLLLEQARLSSPETIEKLAQEKLHLHRTMPQHVVMLDK